MDYRDDLGTVVSVTERKATIRLDHRRTDACGSCCACSVLASGDAVVEVDRGDLNPGDRVHVRIPQVNAYLSMLLLFGLPLVLFMAGIWAGQALEGAERIGNLSIVGGVAGLAVALFVAWLVNRALTRRVGRPQARRLAAEQGSSGGPAHGSV